VKQMNTMCRFALGIAVLGTMIFGQTGFAQTPANGPYKVIKTIKVGGNGGWDYVNADTAGRRVYYVRTGQAPILSAYNMDTFEKVGDITLPSNGHGAVVDPKSGHGFVSTKPIMMFDTKTMKPIKSIEVMGSPDGLFYEAANRRVYVFSHTMPHLTAIDAKDGKVVGTLDLGGEPEMAASDGKGRLFVNLEDKASIAVVDTKKMAVTAHYDLAGKGGTCTGLGLDAKNHVLFSACRMPAAMVMVNANDGKVIATLPINAGTDGAAFNSKTMEAFSSHADGTLTVIKENSPTSFAVEQIVKTMPGARTMTLDTKTGRVITIAAEQGPPTPPTTPGGRAGRGAIVPDSFQILFVGK